MLTSSDAKWRCMWYMLVWSLVMTLVSQFLDIRDHVAFFLFAGVSVLILPVFTAIYSNTSGRHGTGLIRVGYVFMDPVAACITITPVQTLNRLPEVLDMYHCLKNVTIAPNTTTIGCLDNDTAASVMTIPGHRERLLQEQKYKFVIIQAGIVLPVILALFMGRRTIKMNCKTYILTFSYWLVVAIEASDLLETALLCIDYKHVIFTTEAIVSIIMIITNSYAVITLCSYLTPMTVGASYSLQKKKYSKKFDLVYKMFVGCAGVLFVEIPLLIARFQIILTNEAYNFLYGTFYIWMLKDILFICLIIIMLVLQGDIRARLKKASCGPRFDSTHVAFEPEKRDTYIHRRHRAPSPILTPEMIKDRYQLSVLSSSTNSSKANSCEDITPVEPEMLKPQQSLEKQGKGKTKKKVTFKLDMSNRYKESDHLFPI